MRNNLVNPLLLGMAIGVVGTFCYLRREDMLNENGRKVEKKVKHTIDNTIDRINSCY